MLSQATDTFTILIVDDEPPVLKLLTDILSRAFVCVGVGSAETALAELRSNRFGLVISDINLGGMTGVEMIPHVHAASPDTVVMMISGNLTLDSPIEAMRKGAFDYIKKPFDIDYVIAATRRALAHHKLLVSKRMHDEELEKLVDERTAQLNYLTYHDVLTNLPNRALVEDRLGQMIVNKQTDKHNGVMLIAIDRLRVVRETLGPEAANKILQEVSFRIVDLLEPSVTLGRIDGDLFAVLLHDTSPDQCVHLAGRFGESLGRIFEWAGNELHLYSKIGISLDPEDGEDVQTLIQNAAAAVAHARKASGSSFAFYAEGINEYAADRLSLENDLRRAIARHELSVHYQPKVSFENGSITGMEALVRWEHPTRGMVRPDIFIKLAEDIGIINQIGEWVLRTACEQTRLWQKDGFDLELAVNLSGLQLQEENYSRRVVKILEEIEYDPAALNLEITETAIMQDIALSINELKSLRGYGVKVSIDDFGTGYSSLNAFKRLPIDALKIDRSFVKELAEKPVDAAFVKTIIDLTHLMKVKVVAEGVETEAQLSVLQELGCDEWQGYLFSKPLPVDEFRDLLQRTRSEIP